MKTEAKIIQTLSFGTVVINALTGAVSIVPKILTCAVIGGALSLSATIKTMVTTSANIIAGGVNGSPCPIITNIDGGNASTVSYPSINGLLNGGTA